MLKAEILSLILTKVQGFTDLPVGYITFDIAIRAGISVHTFQLSIMGQSGSLPWGPHFVITVFLLFTKNKTTTKKKNMKTILTMW